MEGPELRGVAESVRRIHRYLGYKG
jgi:hypothetical protein